MNKEGLLDQHISRRKLFKIALATALASRFNTSIAHSADEVTAPNETLIPIISVPLESIGTPKDKLWGQIKAEKILEIPLNSAVELRFLISTHIEPTPINQGAGLLIDNGLRAEDPDFSKIMIARIANTEGDLWGLLQQSGRNMKRALIIAPGSESMDFDFTPPLNGNEGSVVVNGEDSLPVILEKPFVNTGKLTFSAYSEGQAISKIMNLEARIRNSS